MGNFVAVSSLVPESAEVSLRGVKLASASGGNVALTVIGGIPGRLMGVVRGKVPARPDPSSGTFQGPETNCFSSLPSGAEGCGRPSPGVLEISSSERAPIVCGSVAVESLTTLGAVS